MFVALNSVTVDNRVPWPEFARVARRAGYGGVDVMLDKAMAEGLDNTRALLAELKLRSSALPLPVEFRKDDEAFQRGMAKLEPAARFARGIGSPRMFTWILPSSQTPAAELRKTYRTRFQAISKVLAASGVRLGLEFVSPVHLRKAQPHEFIWRMGDMLAFAAECGDNIGLLLDSWHWHHAGATPADIVAAGRGRIVHVHLSDAPNLPPEQIRDNQRLLPGDGVIDWKGFFGALHKIGYADALSPEVFGAGLKEKPPEEAARLALEGSLRVMARAGLKPA